MTEFERVSSEIDGDVDYSRTCEFAIEWVKGSKTATVCFPNASRYSTKIRKLAEQYPDEVQIKAENKDKSIVATIPVSYIKISHPPRIELTDEQREGRSKRMKELRNKQLCLSENE